MKEYAELCYLIERDLHQIITPEYPVAKFQAQAQLLKEDYKRQKRGLKGKKGFRHA